MKENSIWHGLSMNTIYNMDCIEGMKLIPDNGIDSIVTDPPYEIWFMGKWWDDTEPELRVTFDTIESPCKAFKYVKYAEHYLSTTKTIPCKLSTRFPQNIVA